MGRRDAGGEDQDDRGRAERRALRGGERRAGGAGGGAEGGPEARGGVLWDGGRERVGAECGRVGEEGGGEDWEGCGAV